MKAKVANKYIRSSFDNIFYVNDSRIEDAVRTIEPFAYNCGVFGWNCDFYEIDGVCISTGYRPIGKSVDYRILKKYDNRAEELSKEQDSDEKFDDLLHEFIKEATNGL
jgi:hypothetical protein